MLLEGNDDIHSHVQDSKLGLRLVRFEMRHADAAEFLERLIDVTDPDPLAVVIFAPPLLIPRSLDLSGQVRQLQVIITIRPSCLVRSM